MPKLSDLDLDGEVVFDRPLADDHTLDLLQEILLELVPKWCSNLRVWESSSTQVPVDPHRPGALRSAVLASAYERGPTYRALIAEHGELPGRRLAGSAELRGASKELTVVIAVDEWAVSQRGATRQLGNHITLQVRKARVAGRPGHEWLRETFATLCSRLSPAWGAAQQVAEYWAKVMQTDRVIQAIGRDFGRFLPGLFWLNFFGRPYVDLVGEERLLTAPAHRCTALDGGVLLETWHDPREWNSPEYALAEERLRHHIGPELFFSKADPDRVTVAPQWDA